MVVTSEALVYNWTKEKVVVVTTGANKTCKIQSNRDHTTQTTHHLLLIYKPHTHTFQFFIVAQIASSQQ